MIKSFQQTGIMKRSLYILITSGDRNIEHIFEKYFHKKCQNIFWYLQEYVSVTWKMHAREILHSLLVCDNKTVAVLTGWFIEAIHHIMMLS